MVCGAADWEASELQAITEYGGSNCRQSSPHMKLFWKALESFDQRERRKFLKFVNGSTWLPITQKFRLQPFRILSSQQHSPESHTCFFQLDLPEYRSLELMQAKLRTASSICGAIDVDDTVRGNEAARMTYSEAD